MNYKGINGKIRMKALNKKEMNDSIVFHRNRQRFMNGVKHTLSGSTEIIAINENGDEQVIDGNIKEVANHVDKFSRIIIHELNEFPILIFDAKYINLEKDDVFVGRVKTTGASEIQLYLDKNKKPSYYLKYVSKAGEIVTSDDSSDWVIGDNYNYDWTSKTLNENRQPIFSQTVPAYSLMPKVDMDLAFDSLRPFEKSSTDLWARFLSSKNTTQGSNRFSMKSTNYGIHVGKNFNIGSNILGGYLTYQQAKTNFEDKYRAENGYIVADKNTGTGKTSAISLGLTATREIPMGVKLDLIGQMTLLNNKYNARDGIQANNKG